jgi:hypothetical protein
MVRDETCRGKRDTAEQSTHGSMELRKRCKGETSKLRGVSIESPGGEETVFQCRKIPLII